MADKCLIRARFEDYHKFGHALKTLKESYVLNYKAYGPVNLTEFENLMPAEGSWVRGFATAGAITGLVGFYFMCKWSSLLYSLITGGKPPVSNVPFVIVSYEGTILLGAIAAFVATLYFARLSGAEVPAHYDKRYSGDSFGIEVPCEDADAERIVRLLEGSGAVEVERC